MGTRVFFVTGALMAASGCTIAGEDDEPIRYQDPENHAQIHCAPCEAEERLAYDTVSCLGSCAAGMAHGRGRLGPPGVRSPKVADKSGRFGSMSSLQDVADPIGADLADAGASEAGMRATPEAKDI